MSNVLIPTSTGTSTGTSTVDRSQFMFRLMHRGMRRDAAALADAIAQVGVGHRTAPEPLRDWFVQFAAIVDHHHRIEDELLWKAVTAVRPRFEDLQLSFADEHDRIRDAADDLATALDALVESPTSTSVQLRARRASRTFEAVLGDHIDREQFLGLPVAAAVLDCDRMIELENEARRQTGAELVTFLGPWLLDHATPEEIVCIIDRTPAPIVTLGRTVWRRRYERSARHVRRARTGSTSATSPRSHRSRTPLAKAGLAGIASIAALTMTVGCGSDAADSAATAPAGTTIVTTVPTSVTLDSIVTVTTNSMPMDSMPMDSMPMDHDSTVPASSVDSTDSPTTSPTTIDAGDERVIDVSMTDFAFSLSRTSVPSGPITFEVTNDGAEGHQMMVGQLHDGETVDSFLETYSSIGEGAAMALVDWDGGQNGIVAGASGEATSVLAEGNYILICFMRDAAGTPHLMLDMVAPLEVTTATDGPQELPVADAVVTVRDYAIEFPEGFQGHGTIELRNEGQEAHELTLMKLAEGKSFPDVVAWFGDPSTPPPFAEAGGIGVVSPGHVGWATMDLEPGHYVALCFVPTADGTPHVMVGMVSEFEVD